MTTATTEPLKLKTSWTHTERKEEDDALGWFNHWNSQSKEEEEKEREMRSKGEKESEDDTDKWYLL